MACESRRPPGRLKRQGSDVGRHMRTIPRHNMCVRGHEMPRPSAKPCFDKLVELLLGISSACPRTRRLSANCRCGRPASSCKAAPSKARRRYTLTEGAQAHSDAEATPSIQVASIQMSSITGASRPESQVLRRVGSASGRTVRLHRAMCCTRSSASLWLDSGCERATNVATSEHW